MKRALSTLFGALAILVLAFLAPASAQTTDSETIPSIELSGEISPATEAWIGRALDQATEEDASLAIIRLDTPGGLDSSLREIVKDMIAAPMPVVVYVTPAGARAASAGVFITEAADVAAMAPETNIGSASPISADGSDIGDTLGRKITNDAAAFVRALATSHGRNPELAERMVREATNVTSQEALDAGLIDLIAADEDDLLRQLDGFEVQGPKAVTLETEGLEVEERDMPFQYDLLQVLVNPNVAF
ncbi:MAG: ATP-dependent Clp protease proteolytic subunit, partial [Solirubrobacterales bacterium]